MSPDERDSLAAVVNYAVGLGDDEGVLSYEQTWRIARAVVARLDSDEAVKTTKLGRFIVRVHLERWTAR